RAAARPLGELELAAARASVRARLGRGDLPELLESEQVAVPLAIGLLRPAVVLPARLVAAATDDELADVLVHECAHHFGGDLLVAVLELAGRVLYWPNPLLHRLARRLAIAREAACDDLVVAHAPATRFARTLLACASAAAREGAGERVACGGIALVPP